MVIAKILNLVVDGGNRVVVHVNYKIDGKELGPEFIEHIIPLETLYMSDATVLANKIRTVINTYAKELVSKSFFEVVSNNLSNILKSELLNETITVDEVTADKYDPETEIVDSYIIKSDGTAIKQ